MAKTGRPPKPTALHVLNGNPSKKKNLGENEPKPAPIIKIPPPPEWLNEHGANMWERLAPILERLGLLTEADIETFSAACSSWGVYRECQDFVNDEGLTHKYKNKGGAINEVERPQVKIGNKALDQYRAFCSEFGLSPASRTRIEVNSQDTESEMEGLLSGVK